MTETKTCPKCGADVPENAPEGICPTCLLLAGLPGEPVVEAGPDWEPTSAVTSGFMPPEPDELAKDFPQLEILQLLGKGGMGAVYKARQLGLDRLVAVKILPPEVGADAAFAERFTREARALAKLSHQNIVSVFDFGQVDGQYYFLMEFVDGANLRQLMETDGIQPDEALAIVPQICEALQFAHKEGIVHRDIKPENILIDKQGRVKIADFGLAKLLGRATEDPRLTGTRQAMGTLHYMAPEQMQGAGSVDNRADIYSLGVVFYEMLTGELPIGRFAPPSRKVQVDVRLDKVVLRALENEPERRYQQAIEVKTDIDSIASAPSPALDKTPRPEAAGLAAGNAGWPTPRFSRKAVLGAVWAAFFFVAILPSTFITHSDSGSPLWYLAVFLLLALLPLGATAPFGTTVLGVVSVSEIRRSRGRLIGLTLALADALLFPLLLLDALIFFVCSPLVAMAAERILDESFEISNRQIMALSGMIAMIVGGLICVVVDFLIVFWAWRWAAREPESRESTVKP